MNNVSFNITSHYQNFLRCGWQYNLSLEDLLTIHLNNVEITCKDNILSIIHKTSPDDEEYDSPIMYDETTDFIKENIFPWVKYKFKGEDINIDLTLKKVMDHSLTFLYHYKRLDDFDQDTKYVFEKGSL